MNYQEVFGQRGQAYHEAMKRWPDARRHEFVLPLEKLRLRSAERLVDLPSGGGYLQRYLPQGVELYCLESCELFVARCRASQLNVSLFSHDSLPLSDCYADKLLSIAGLHHIEDKKPLFAEMHRVLKPGGKLCIVDVQEGSPVAGFLDDVVNRYSATGHRGIFLGAFTADDIADAGFVGVSYETLCYSWVFEAEEELLRYCKLLFGLEKASLEEIQQGIDDYLKVTVLNGEWHLNWQLICFTAHRPDHR